MLCDVVHLVRCTDCTHTVAVFDPAGLIDLRLVGLLGLEHGDDLLRAEPGSFEHGDRDAHAAASSYARHHRLMRAPPLFSCPDSWPRPACA